MPKKKSRGLMDGTSLFAVPMTMLRHRNFTRIGPHPAKLLWDLAKQYTGFNNGYLCCSWALMKDQGWNSTHTLRAAMLELEHYRLIVRTRQGGLNKATLHGFTWRKIDERPGKDLDMLPTISPPDSWKHDTIPDFVMPAPVTRKKGRASLKAVA